MNDSRINVEISLDEFNRTPRLYLGEVRGLSDDGNKDYLVSAACGYQGTDVILTPFYKGDIVRTENLNNYTKNPIAFERAMNRVFEEAMQGEGAVALTITDPWGNRNISYAHPSNHH